MERVHAMSDKIVNLNKVRKARQRDEAKRLAEENRARFGRSKAERDIVGKEQRRADGKLDGAERVPTRLDENHDDLDSGNVS